jgi:hypothetical protein
MGSRISACWLTGSDECDERRCDVGELHTFFFFFGDLRCALRRRILGFFFYSNADQIYSPSKQEGIKSSQRWLRHSPLSNSYILTQS